MENSFYYFFSATPQVLGGILALFGVFMVFKVQSVKSQLFGIGKTTITNSKKYINIKSIVRGQNKDTTIADIESCIDKGDINELLKVMQTITDDAFLHLRIQYDELHTYIKTLTNIAIGASIYTAGIIFVTLLIIPFGCFFLQHHCFLYILFAVVILAIGICLYAFIKVLIKSFDDII